MSRTPSGPPQLAAATPIRGAGPAAAASGLAGGRRRGPASAHNLDKSQDRDMRGHAMAKRHGAAISGLGRPSRQIDLDVVMLEEGAVERIGSLVDRLLDRKQQPGLKR